MVHYVDERVHCEAQAEARQTVDPCELEDSRESGPGAARVSTAIKSLLACVGEGPQNCTGVLIHDLTKVHGDREHKDKKEQVDAKD